MYVLNYSLDNLSLMALTIAVGFVVDDAIVMLENIYRHIETGMSPLEATLKGAGEIGFTIMSISVSLVAVFIPLLLMGGIIGRLVPRIRHHHDADHRGLGVRRADPFAHHVRPVPARREASRAARPRLHGGANAVFDRLLAWYTRGLDLALDHQRTTLLVFLTTVAVTTILYIEIPKGFFPQQDTGIIPGLSDAPQDISFHEMVRRQHALLNVVAEGSRTSRATAPDSAVAGPSTTDSW